MNDKESLEIIIQGVCIYGFTKWELDLKSLFTRPVVLHQRLNVLDPSHVIRSLGHVTQSLGHVMLVVQTLGQNGFNLLHDDLLFSKTLQNTTKQGTDSHIYSLHLTQ